MKNDRSARDVAEGWDNFQREFKGSDFGEGFFSQVPTGSFGTGTGDSSLSGWVWWNDKGIWHRQINGSMNGPHLKVTRIRIGYIAVDRESTLSSMPMGRSCSSESTARIREGLGLG